MTLDRYIILKEFFFSPARNTSKKVSVRHFCCLKLQMITSGGSRCLPIAGGKYIWGRTHMHTNNRIEYWSLIVVHFPHA